MEIYILDGQELTLEQLQALADDAGAGLEDFKFYKGVTVKKKDVADLDATVASTNTAASLESQLANTKSDWEKYRKSQLLNKEGKYDPNLQTDPNHRMPDGSQNYINKRNEFTIKERELNDKIEGYYLDPKNMDFNKPKTILNQGEDTVKEYIREKFPFYNVEDGTAGNLLKIQTAEGFKEIDLNPLFSDNKKEAIETIKYLEQAAKDIEDDVVVGLVMNKLADNIKDTGDVSSVNTYLKDNTPYQIEKTIVPGKTSTGLQGVSTPDTTMYNIVKDGEIISSLPIDKVDDFLRDNITQEEFNSMNTTSVKALETVTGMRRAYIEQQQDIVEVKPATKIKYYKDDFGTDVLKVLDRLNFTDEEKQTVEKYIANTQSQKGEMQLATAPGMARRQGASPYQIIQELTALDGLPDDLKEKLINAGFIDEMKTVVDAGIKNTAFKEVNKGIPTMLEDMLTQFDKGELLDLANYFNENIAGAEKDEEGNIIKGEFVKKINVDNLDLDGSIKDQIKIGGNCKSSTAF